MNINNNIVHIENLLSPIGWFESPEKVIIKTELNSLAQHIFEYVKHTDETLVVSPGLGQLSILVDSLDPELSEKIMLFKEVILHLKEEAQLASSSSEENNEIETFSQAVCSSSTSDDNGSRYIQDELISTEKKYLNRLKLLQTYMNKININEEIIKQLIDQSEKALELIESGDDPLNARICQAFIDSENYCNPFAQFLNNRDALQKAMQHDRRTPQRELRNGLKDLLKGEGVYAVTSSFDDSVSSIFDVISRRPLLLKELLKGLSAKEQNEDIKNNLEQLISGLDTEFSKHFK